MPPHKTKVLLLCTAHPPNDPRIVFKVANSLKDHYDVTCALPNAQQNTLENVEFVALPFYPKLKDRIWRVHPLVVWKLLKIKPDVVQVFVPELIPIAFLFKFFGAKIIYEVHENLPKKFQTKTFNNGKLFQFLFTYFDGLARRYFYLIFTEQSYLAYYKNLKKPHEVIANFAPLSLLDALRKPYRSGNAALVEFLYVGVISFERCIDTLIVALSILKRKQPNVVMHLFGKVNFEMAELEKIESYAEVRQNLIFYGYTDLRLAYQKAQNAVAGVAMLKAVGDYPESYTTKMFDYMALGLPVLTSDFELYKDVIETANCGFCLPPTDSELLAKSMIWLTENPQMAKQMGERGRTAAEKKYNWAFEEAKLLAFYQKLITD